MKEARGNLWTFPADAYVITTNGFVKKNGAAVMGRGCAKEALDKFPGIAQVLGKRIQEHGNHISLIWQHPFVISFPVKHNWWEKADIDLIKRSAEELVELVGYADKNSQYYPFQQVVLPRPGCGNGQLNWEDVKPVIEPILDDRYTVITF